MLKRIRLISIIITVVVSLILLIFSYTYMLGFLLGSLTSIFGFEMICYVGQNAETQVLKKSLKRNRGIRYFVYIIIVFIAIYFNKTFNLICFLVALSVTKIAILIDNFIVRKVGDKNNDIDI